LQRLENPATQPALRALVAEPHTYTRVFAAKGLGMTRDRSAVPLLIPLVSSGDSLVAIEAVRALGRIGDPAATPALLALLHARGTAPHLRLEAVTAVAGLGGEGVSDTLLDLLGDPGSAVRAAALEGLARLDPDGFVFILSGLDPDPQWSVRAALATALGSLSAETALPRLRVMLSDPDQRVVSAVLPAIAALRPPDASEIMLVRLKVDDPVVRAAAASALAQLLPPQGAPALAAAYRLGQRDQTYVARAAALTALAGYGTPDAVQVLNEALTDADWAVRVRAAALLRTIDPTNDASLRIRPVPSQATPDQYSAPHVLRPTVSTQLHLETDRGTIQIELAVLDAPQTVENIVTLARKGFYDGLSFHRVVPGFVVQAGDPRGDGEGGPGYTIRDELNDRTYVRGTVGMALDWEDTGGSQFFIVQSPQPHLDARYTVVGRVISGMEVVDQIERWDVLRRVRVWDGETFALMQ
jgi:cyclophilin family peptidyl-prolyl cis-trans isomerase